MTFPRPPESSPDGGIDQDISGGMDPNQALLTGQLAGFLLCDRNNLEVDVPVVDGNYTNKIIVKRPSGSYTITVDGPYAKPT